MAKRLQVPPELEMLIEKRDDETDRRTGDRRSTAKAKAATNAKSGQERRATDRRKKRRRRADTK